MYFVPKYNPTFGFIHSVHLQKRRMLGIKRTLLIIFIFYQQSLTLMTFLRSYNWIQTLEVGATVCRCLSDVLHIAFSNSACSNINIYRLTLWYSDIMLLWMLLACCGTSWQQQNTASFFDFHLSATGFFVVFKIHICIGTNMQCTQEEFYVLHHNQPGFNLTLLEYMHDVKLRWNICYGNWTML